jgi:proteic killer suppression protein
MIQSFKHRGLKALYDGRTARKVAPAHVEKLRDILSVLDRSHGPDDVNIPGFGLHPLKGNLAGFWACIGLRELARNIPLRQRSCS